MGEGARERLKMEKPRWEGDFEQLAGVWGGLSEADFVFAFHAFPDCSVGHLHMHVFPRGGWLRRFSGKRHDWKTIPLEAILEVEREDGGKGGGEGGEGRLEGG